MTCYHEPLKDKDRERRDGLHKKTLGDTGKPRKQPHRGSDWGYKNGSKGRDFRAIHDGTITKILETAELGCSVIIKNDPCDNPACAGGVWIGYNHAETPTALKVGDKVVGGVTPINKMSDKGSRGAPHLHAAAAKHPIPHVASRELLLDLFALIDASRAQRQAAKAAAATATPPGANK